MEIRLTALLAEDACYADRLEQPLSLRSKLEWAIKSVVDTSLANWLVSKGKSNEFLIAKGHDQQYKLQSTAYRWNPLHEKAEKGVKSGFSSVNFSGEMQVTDIDAFSQDLFTGVGRSKAFGCGLLLIRRS